MEILIDYISKHQLLLTKWVETFDLEDYKKSIQYFNILCKRHKIKHIIHNISELTYKEREEDYNIEIISAAAKLRSMIPNSNYTVVFITQKPKDVVYTHIYAQELEIEENYLYCSTTEKAQELLLIVDPSLDLDAKFSAIKNNIKDIIQ